MKIDYQDHGAIARITLRVCLTEWRRLAGAVDAAALSADVAVTRSGGLLRTATITGRTPAVMRSVAR
ncbi:hypothetical protein [Erwinia psidii]|uniref:Uncharacterized protein n=1 Tax=Erwinia psidii TaxID=69224 RepID=A0A3N6TPW2_9GAMM|nr:hypothetical protein [Erwinia psidii]MCX8966898.1 hypothetical protein [Erwinia psidii]RQM37272.1 hypothetical protein EB241_16555 [Erwinia psidii]